MPDGHDDDGLPGVSNDAPGRTRADNEPLGSLFDDAYALYEDGRTYAAAEVAFQKSRAAFASRQSIKGAIFAVGALAFLHLASIGLVIGLIFALAPILSAFGATALVVGVLVVVMIVLAAIARKHFKRVAGAFGNSDGNGADS